MHDYNTEAVQGAPKHQAVPLHPLQPEAAPFPEPPAERRTGLLGGSDAHPLYSNGKPYRGGAPYTEPLSARDQRRLDDNYLESNDRSECWICLEPLHPHQLAECGHIRHANILLDCCVCNAHQGPEAEHDLDDDDVRRKRPDRQRGMLKAYRDLSSSSSPPSPGASSRSQSTHAAPPGQSQSPSSCQAAAPQDSGSESDTDSTTAVFGGRQYVSALADVDPSPPPPPTPFSMSPPSDWYMNPPAQAHARVMVHHSEPASPLPPCLPPEVPLPPCLPPEGMESDPTHTPRSLRHRLAPPTRSRVLSPASVPLADHPLLRASALLTAMSSPLTSSRTQGHPLLETGQDPHLPLQARAVAHNHPLLARVTLLSPLGQAATELADPPPRQCICGRHGARCIHVAEPNRFGLCTQCYPGWNTSEPDCGCLCGGCEDHDYNSDARRAAANRAAPRPVWPAATTRHLMGPRLPPTTVGRYSVSAARPHPLLVASMELHRLSPSALDPLPPAALPLAATAAMCSHPLLRAAADSTPPSSSLPPSTTTPFFPAAFPPAAAVVAHAHPLLRKVPGSIQQLPGPPPPPSADSDELLRTRDVYVRRSTLSRNASAKQKGRRGFCQPIIDAGWGLFLARDMKKDEVVLDYRFVGGREGVEVERLDAVQLKERYPNPLRPATHVLQPSGAHVYFDTLRCRGIGGFANSNQGHQNCLFRGSKVHVGKKNLTVNTEIFLAYSHDGSYQWAKDKEPEPDFYHHPTNFTFHRCRPKSPKRQANPSPWKGLLHHHPALSHLSHLRHGSFATQSYRLSGPSMRLRVTSPRDVIPSKTPPPSPPPARRTDHVATAHTTLHRRRSHSSSSLTLPPLPEEDASLPVPPYQPAPLGSAHTGPPRHCSCGSHGERCIFLAAPGRYGLCGNCHLGWRPESEPCGCSCAGCDEHDYPLLTGVPSLLPVPSPSSAVGTPPCHCRSTFPVLCAQREGPRV